MPEDTKAFAIFHSFEFILSSDCRIQFDSLSPLAVSRMFLCFSSGMVH